MSAALQHWWAILFTVIVAVLTAAGVGLAIYMRTTGYISKRRMWSSIKQTVNTPFNPYPDRPIDPERYRRGDEEIKRLERMKELAAGNPEILYKLELSAQVNELKHIDGIPWNKAELPPVNHVCWPQTDAWLMFRQVQRCACGAIRESDYPEWTRINERKRK